MKPVNPIYQTITQKSVSKENRNTRIANSKEHHLNSIQTTKKSHEDELSTLDKLSYMNAGARYELLSINQQLLNFDLKFKVIIACK